MKNFKEYIFPSIALLIICFAVTLALAATYSITTPVIKEVNIARANAARTEVLPDGNAAFSQIEPETLVDGVEDVYTADNGSGVVITTSDKGFGGKIRVMTGFDNSGAIVAVKLIEHKETPGLGTKVMSPDYLGQYTGKTSLEGIDAISGSTISSMAMYRAVDKAVRQYPEIGGAMQ